VTLDVVGSNPTTYPLKNTLDLNFLKNVVFKKSMFYGNIDGDSNIYIYKDFRSSNIFIAFYYYHFLKKKYEDNNYFKKNNYYIIINKRKNHYRMSVIKNNELMFNISIGTMLVFFNLTRKYLRRSRKGFLIFINVFKEFFKQNNNNNINILINFIDQNLIIFKKNFLTSIKLDGLFIFNFNIPFSFIKYKKYKHIKKRLKKKIFKEFSM